MALPLAGVPRISSSSSSTTLLLKRQPIAPLGVEINYRRAYFPESSSSLKSELRFVLDSACYGYKTAICSGNGSGDLALHVCFHTVFGLTLQGMRTGRSSVLDSFPRRRGDYPWRKKMKLSFQGMRRPMCAVGNNGGPSSNQPGDTSSHQLLGDGLFHVEDPRTRTPPWRGRLFDVYSAWEVVRLDLLYCDWKARRDVFAIKTLHDKVVDVLNPMARDRKSIETLRTELAELQQDLSKAHEHVHLSESRVSRSLQKLAEMEALVNDKLLRDKLLTEQSQVDGDMQSKIAVPAPTSVGARNRNQISWQKFLNVSGPVRAYSPALKEFWYPVAFSADIKDDTMVPFECFEESWVLFRGKGGRIGCVQNCCAHRSCPLHLGIVKDGCIQCPYHGWEYSTSGVCEKMPSTKPVNVSIRSLPCVEQSGMVWVWPGDEIPEASVPFLAPPPGFTIHAQIVMELPVEHGLLMENLLDLAHAPFTHTTTFARGWPVPSLVRFCTPVTALQGHWDPYPIDMEFQPPCMVRSTIGISKPGRLDGSSTSNCSKHLHQLHVCLPSAHNKTRLLYQMSLDFYPMLKHVPYIQLLWKHLAKKVLDEDLRLVLGQQDRMTRGANIWNMPVAYDKLGVRYRRWRLLVEAGENFPPGR